MEPLQTAFSKTKVFVFVCFDSFGIILLMKVLSISIVDFRDPRVNDTLYGSFREQISWILRSFDLNSVLTRQTLEKIVYNHGLDNLLECFLPCTCTFGRICALPKTFLSLGREGG